MRLVSGALGWQKNRPVGPQWGAQVVGVGGGGEGSSWGRGLRWAGLYRRAVRLQRARARRHAGRFKNFLQPGPSGLSAACAARGPRAAQLHPGAELHLARNPGPGLRVAFGLTPRWRGSPWFTSCTRASRPVPSSFPTLRRMPWAAAWCR